ncbi:hypothetical protein R1sor_010820 [Riccia sorocarpa]|uniref:Endonuclease/exonuclease/phosphatase domain-containing protein n=1 Tax=Riccia sorocarpa TaxID=122646 RepID=A0ABD3I103_9MARC
MQTTTGADFNNVTADFKIASWNLNGVANPDRVKVIRQWFRARHYLGIIAFHELKAKKTKASWNLKSIFPKGRVVIDFDDNEKGGATIVVSDAQKVINNGISGDDHFPITSEFQLNPDAGNTSREWRTYSKFRIEEMRSEVVKNQIEQAWRNNPKGVSDPRVKWELGCKRVKRVMQRIRKDEREKTSQEASLKTELEQLRTLIARENTQVNKKRLATLESQVKEKELKDTRVWRLRSRARWLREGDASSYYLFAILKSKSKREEMLRVDGISAPLITLFPLHVNKSAPKSGHSVSGQPRHLIADSCWIKVWLSLGPVRGMLSPGDDPSPMSCHHTTPSARSYRTPV